MAKSGIAAMMMEEPEAASGGISIPLPPGFQPPQGVAEGDLFSTTVTGKIIGGNFEVESIGDSPVGGGEQPSMDDEGAEEAAEMEQEPEMSEYQRRKADEDEARRVFQPGRMG